VCYFVEEADSHRDMCWLGGGGHANVHRGVR
jgi:hypothetical protein